MNGASTVRQLLADLLDDQQHFQAIETILSAQRQAVLSFAQTQLDSLNQQLMQRYQLIHQHAKQRISGLQQLGFSADHQGMNHLLAGLPAAAQQHLLKLWHELPAQLHRCQQANRYNQQLLEMQQSILLESLPGLDNEFAWLYHPNEMD